MCMCICVVLMRENKALLAFFDFSVWLSSCTTCVHHPLLNYIRQQNERRSLPWNSWIWQEKQLEREIDAPEHSSSQHLAWVIINGSTNTPFKSPPIDIFDIAQGVVHLLFHTSVMVQLAPTPASPRSPLSLLPPSLKHTQTHTHIHFSFFPVCGWNDYWRLGLDLKCVGEQRRCRVWWWWRGLVWTWNSSSLGG